MDFAKSSTFSSFIATSNQNSKVFFHSLLSSSSSILKDLKNSIMTLKSLASLIVISLCGDLKGIDLKAL